MVSGRRALLVEVSWLIYDGRGARVYCCNDEMAHRVTTRVQVLEPNAIIGIGINPCAHIYMSALLHCTCAYADMPVGRLPSRRPIERLPSRRSEGCPPDVGSPPDGALRVQKSTCRIIQLHQHPTHAHEFMFTTTHALKFTFTNTHAHKLPPSASDATVSTALSRAAHRRSLDPGRHRFWPRRRFRRFSMELEVDWTVRSEGT